MENTLYKDEFIIVSFDKSKNIIIKDWQKEVSADKFRETLYIILTEIINICKKNKNVTIFVDARKLGAEAFNAENIVWSEKNAHPIYAKNGIAKKVFFVSENIGTNLPVVKYISSNNNTDNGVAMNIFTNEEEAKNWLLS